MFRLSYTYLMWKRLGGEPLYNAEVAISMILILSGSFPRYTQWEWYLNLQKENWFFGITHLYYPRSPMFVSLDKSFNVGGISRTPRESFGGTLPFMIHRGGPSPSFLVRTFKPFRPWPKIESTTLTIAPHDLHVISVEIEIVVRDWWGLIINCHWCEVATSSNSPLRRVIFCSFPVLFFSLKGGTQKSFWVPIFLFSSLSPQVFSSYSYSSSLVTSLALLRCAPALYISLSSF